MAMTSDAQGKAVVEQEADQLHPFHPTFGVRPGNHARYLRKAFKPEPATSGQPAPVKRERKEQAWTMIDGVGVTPEIAKHFGGGDKRTVLVRFFVNGQAVEISEGDVPVRTSLAEYLRNYMGLTGTKVSCGEAGCGACTVVLKKGMVTRVANACVRPVLSMEDDVDVTTTEGLGSSASPHSIQQKMTDCFASQCGMCTPGMVMSIYGYLEKANEGTVTLDATEQDKCLQGNTCRCTGYRPIYQAVHELFDAAKATQEEAPEKEEQRQKEEAFEVPTRRFHTASTDAKFLNCANLADVFVALNTYGGQPHRLLVGGTSAGVVKYFPNTSHQNDDPNIFINIAGVADLRHIVNNGTTISFGAAVTISEVITSLSGVAGLEAVVAHLKVVATPQVRDMSSWAGNLMIAKTHADFPSDIMTILTMLNTTLTISDGTTDTTETVDGFLHSPAALPYNKIITKMEFPLPGANDVIDSYKIMRRATNTHTEVSGSFHFSFEQDNTTLKTARIVYSNIIHGPLVCPLTAAELVGKTLEVDQVQDALNMLATEAVVQAATTSDPNFLEGGAPYREALAKNLLYKAWIGAIVAKKGTGAVDASLLTAAEKYVRPRSSGAQSFATPEGYNFSPVGQNVLKLEGLTQATGEAKFTAEVAKPANTVYGYVIMAKEIGRIQRIDASNALGQHGVVAFIAADTVRAVGANHSVAGTTFEVFATSETKFVGQPVGMICANTWVEAQYAAGLVVVTYQARKPANRLPANIKEAVAAGQIKKDPHPIKIRGAAPNTTNDVATTTHEITGFVESKGQKHCYMENQTAFAFPADNGGLKVIVSTQMVDADGVGAVKPAVCGTMNMPQNMVEVEFYRTGGGYGGKNEWSSPMATVASVACKFLNRPVLVQLDLNTDMIMFGQRPHHTSNYTLTYTVSEDGLTKDITKIVQANTTDLGAAGIAFLAVASNANCYFNDRGGAGLPVWFEATNDGVSSLTPTPTFMRAPGHFAGAMFMEAIMEHVAREWGEDPTVVQRRYLHDLAAPTWDACKVQADYDAKRTAITAYNAANKFTKRGIYMMGCVYGTFDWWTERATVAIHSDGSITMNHTGMELGQGINTKAAQTITYELKKVASDFDLSLVVMSAQSTKNINFSGVTPTYGSGTSEGVCYAMKNACEKLAAILDTYKDQGTWTAIVTAAVAAGEALTQEGARFAAGGPGYNVSVATCMEAEIDVLTGEKRILSCEISHDGLTLNPAVDAGQVEGSIMQALGFSLTEEVHRSPVDARLLNHGTWDYKIPSGLDIPIVCNVTFLDNANTNSLNVYGSRLTGEPATLTGGAAFFAVKDAVLAARADNGLTGWFEATFPITVENVQQLCGASV